jgi:hypothetical protein
VIGDSKEEAVYDWIDIELARQRREELLREAREKRRISAAGRTAESSGELTASILRLLRSMWPGVVPVAKTERPGAPVHECSAD